MTALSYSYSACAVLVLVLETAWGSEWEYEYHFIEYEYGFAVSFGGVQREISNLERLTSRRSPDRKGLLGQSWVQNGHP